MATPKQFIKQLFDLKGVFVEDFEFKENNSKENEFYLYVRLGKKLAKRCPFVIKSVLDMTSCKHTGNGTLLI